MSSGLEARRLLRSCREGALGTWSLHLAGYPFVSLVPFVLDSCARPVLLVSRLAEHTRNLVADARASLAAHRDAEDMQAGARLTIMGTCRRALERDTLAERYLRYYPQSSRLLDLDFDFYRLAADAIRYIAGFGGVAWVDLDEFHARADALAAVESEAIEHMNTDHVSTLVDYCRHVHGLTPASARVIGIDCDGFDVRADRRILRFDFPECVHDAHALRSAFAALATASRA